MEKTYIIKIYGRVQSIGYQRYVCNLATESGIKGSIEIKADGSITIMACFNASKIDKFLEGLQAGKDQYDISCIKIQETSAISFDDFKVHNN